MLDFWHAVTSYTTFSIGGVIWRICGAAQIAGINQELVKDSSGSGVLGTEQPNLRLLQELLSSNLTVGILINFVANIAILLFLLAKAIFFGPLALQEAQKLAERLINYVLFKVLFLMAVSRSEDPGALWLPWFALLGFFKIFSGLARDRFERLCSSPAASIWSHFRTLSALVLVLACDLFCMQACIKLQLHKGGSLSSLLLLNFEAVIIALDTSQTLVQYALHLAETFLEFPSSGSTSCIGFCGMSSATWAERRGQLLFYLNLNCDLAHLLLTLAHYAHIWWLHGLAFQIVDGVLLMNIRALAVAVFRRVRQVLKYRHAMHNLRTLFADATPEDIQDFNDDCAICKEPMAVAKRLPCKHLFHIGCLRSWFDQGSAGAYSCPTCRFSLLSPLPRQLGGDTSAPLQGARENVGPQEQIRLTDTAVVNEDFGADGLDSIPLNAQLNQMNQMSQMNPRFNFGGTATGQADLNGIQESPAESQHWWWPFRHPGGVDTGGVGPLRREMNHPALSSGGLRFRGQRGPWRSQFRSQSRSMGSNSSNLLAEDSRFSAMASQVQEVLPHVPRSMIIQDLRRTNSVQITVEHLLVTFGFGS